MLKKATATTFQPGQSGNPGGRSKASREVQRAAAEHSISAVERLVQLMTKSKSEKIQLDAARELLDRGVGKAIQTLANDGDNPLQFGTVIIIPDNGRDKGDERDQASAAPVQAPLEPG